ncbi:MAG: HNH endonuclease [Candidatus Doudnabacteria bacterium]
MAEETGLPFDRYTGGGRRLLGVPAFGDGSSRRGYGPAVFEQCGFVCAYCGHEMETAYEVWLSLSVDHVIPTGVAKRLGYAPEWVQDISNQVTCCRACNEFLNGYKVTDPAPATVEKFFDLRDRHFLAKEIALTHEALRTSSADPCTRRAELEAGVVPVWSRAAKRGVRGAICRGFPRSAVSRSESAGQSRRPSAPYSRLRFPAWRAPRNAAVRRQRRPVLVAVSVS